MAKKAFGIEAIFEQLMTSWGGANEGISRAWLTDTITYVIPDVAPAGRGSEASAFVPLTPFMKQEARLAFELWDDVIARNLTETTSPTAGISLARSNRTSENGTYTRPDLVARGSYHEIRHEDIWFTTTWASNGEAGFALGAYGFATAIHEIGHALGFSHPGSYNAGGNLDFGGFGGRQAA